MTVTTTVKLTSEDIYQAVKEFLLSKGYRTELVHASVRTSEGTVFDNSNNTDGKIQMEADVEKIDQ